MAYVKLDENGVVIQKQPYDSDGFIEVGDNVVCGMVFESGVFVTPPPTEEALTNFLVQYAQGVENGPLEHEGFTENGDEGQRRAAKEVVDFLRELGENAPATIKWDGTYGVQDVSLETLLGWLMMVGMRRQKRFVAQITVKSSISEYTSTQEVTDAFQNAFEM